MMRGKIKHHTDLDLNKMQNENNLSLFSGASPDGPNSLNRLRHKNLDKVTTTLTTTTDDNYMDSE
jgi:hypothetical protein